MEAIIHAFTGIFAVLMGGAVILVPVLALSTRYAFRPILETWMRMQNKVPGAGIEQLERRIALLEGELQSVQRRLRALQEAEEFHSEITTIPPTRRDEVGKGAGE